MPCSGGYPPDYCYEPLSINKLQEDRDFFKRELDEATRLLCGMLKLCNNIPYDGDEQLLRLELEVWWRKHCKLDQKRNGM